MPNHIIVQRSKTIMLHFPFMKCFLVLGIFLIGCTLQLPNEQSASASINQSCIEQAKQLLPDTFVLTKSQQAWGMQKSNKWNDGTEFDTNKYFLPGQETGQNVNHLYPNSAYAEILKYSKTITSDEGVIVGDRTFSYRIGEIRQIPGTQEPLGLTFTADFEILQGEFVACNWL